MRNQDVDKLTCEEQRNYAKARYELQTLYHELYMRFHRKFRSNEACYHSLTFK